MSKDRPDSDKEYIKKIKPGVKGDISVEAGTNKGVYPSEVEFVGDDSAVTFTHPLLKGSLLPVYRDMDFKFTFDDGGALYIFEMSVVKSLKNGGLPLLKSKIIEDPVRIQRRSFLRIACNWNVRIFQLENELADPLTSVWLSGTALDISLRGTRFMVEGENAEKVSFRSGDKVLIGFDFSGKEFFLTGTASRIERTDHSWEVGLRFDSVAISIEKKLFEYIRQCEIMGREEQ